jgi:hypothetical protein
MTLSARVDNLQKQWRKSVAKMKMKAQKNIQLIEKKLGFAPRCAWCTEKLLCPMYAELPFQWRRKHIKSVRCGDYTCSKR